MRLHLAPGVVLLLALALASPAVARDLTFEERVNAQEAIERVYYSHQIGTKRPFEEAVPRSILDKKVRTYLKESVALETFWKTKVTAEMLRKEWERMVSHSRMPDRLRELSRSLGDDPFLIQECLARPTLVDRLARNFFAYDRSIQETSRQKAELLRAQIEAGEIDPRSENAVRTVVHVVRGVAESVGHGPDADSDQNGREGGSEVRMTLNPAQFDSWRSRLRQANRKVGALTEEPSRFLLQVFLSDEQDSLRVANFTIEKKDWNNWWDSANRGLDPLSVHSATSALIPLGTEGQTTPVNDAPPFTVASGCATDDVWESVSSIDGLPEGPRGHTAVWTGSVMVVWGGSGGDDYLNNGARYDPATDTWAPTSTVNAPTARSGHTAIWTGSTMVIWGGLNLSDNYLDSGGRYDPLLDLWTPTAKANAPRDRFGHTAIWSGNHMIVWGGRTFLPSDARAGGQYDPASDAWTPMASTGAPSERAGQTAVWTGSQMIIWGGEGPFGSELNSGGLYDPDTDTWTSTATPGSLPGRHGHTAVWTGKVMIVWGGAAFGSSGGRYDPSNDTWTGITETDGPVRRSDHSAVWTGERMLVWGGVDPFGGYNLNDGGGYDPLTDRWSALSTAGAPSERANHVAVWTGRLMIVWGGDYLLSGGRYDPLTDSWTPTFMGAAPSPRISHTTIWTGTHMIVWGGADTGSAYTSTATGSRYDPVTDTWVQTSMLGAPTARQAHTAVWTGDSMIVWGGFDSSWTNTGGRYDPLTDTWELTSVGNAPSVRAGHVTVWTGHFMVVWGGFNGGSYLNSGGRYDPVSDSWLTTASFNVPSPRSVSTAVWTTKEMIVWGGDFGRGNVGNDGGRYDPEADIWRPTSTIGAPSGRALHTAVWTDHEMIVWGGTGFPANNTGGRYDPISDSWKSTSTLNAPIGRLDHSAVWSGRQMIVWGGEDRFFYGFLNSGGRYDPAADRWTNTSIDGAPTRRSLHDSVWTGDSMIVWGGWNPSTNFFFNSGGRYCACEMLSFYRDGDADGYGDPNVSTRACLPPEGYVANQEDCDDTASGIHPEAGEVCNASDDDCDGQTDEGFDVGSACADDLDQCHRVIGIRQCRADGAGTQCSGESILHDTTPPAIVCPAETTLECPASSGSLGMPLVTDACDPEPLVVNDAAVSLPLGANEVVWFATDASGNRAGCTQHVEVSDTQPPRISMIATPDVLWPPNHRMMAVQVGIQVDDSCDMSSVPALVSVRSNEPDDAPGGGDGNTTTDIRDVSIGTADTSIVLRAERSADGPGRIYTLTYVARDASGNMASAQRVVSVPHDGDGGPEPLMIRLENDWIPGMAYISWEGIGVARIYDVIQGDLGQVTVSNEGIRLGPVHVLALGQIETSYSEDARGSTPAVGSAFFYLVQYREGQSASGWGTESSPWPADPTSCDTKCPGEPISASFASRANHRR